jgi:hypothetical protein
MDVHDADLEVDVAGALGAHGAMAPQQLTLYIPDRDRAGVELGTQRRWVLEAAALLTEIGGGVTISPAVEGGWLDPATGTIVWERPVQVYAFVHSAAFISALPRLRAFLHRMGRQAGQGEVVAEFDGRLFRITDYEEL